MAQLTDEELASIAHDYYLSKLNIADISQKYNLSRYLITKALDDAEEKQIVRISIKRGVKRNEDLERKLQNRFSLKEVIVLNNLDTTNQDNEAIVSYAAKEIQSYLKSAKSAGMTWGTLMRDIINNFQEEQRPDLTFVQLLGQTINSDKRKNSLEQLAAQKYNSQSLLLPAPLYVINPNFLNNIQEEPFYQSLKNYYDKLDVIFSGLGTYEAFSTNKYLQKYYQQQLFKDIPTEEIVGMIFGRPYNIKGEFLGDFDHHVCGISLEDIMKTPVRFLVVKNRFKSKSLLGALRTGVVTNLVTNEGIAERILEEKK
ncbi:sugar-binding transcriptional regulator [Lactobacillus kalixensis]|uniref:Transcriptional regulator n=1 Tax=Lactobacillus kalixensis DSM 16043 TaxID=1423763 RepID=A0A0R1UA58_9LACO|nr:sugar-binding domain-containing protein [Lactobacillus kalixensis]KRL89524.1 transcriptional regulator [Lactobacillus kalixensis DSM 16043]